MAVPVRTAPLLPSVQSTGIGNVGSPLYRPSANELYTPGIGESLKALSAPADAMMGVAVAEARIENATAAKSLENDFIRQTQDIMHNGDTAYFKNQGLAAKEKFEPTMTTLQDAADKVLARTGNSGQRRMLEAAVNDRITSIRGQMSTFQQEQVKNWQVNTQLGGAQIHAQNATLTPFDDKAVTESAERVHSSTLAAFKLKGMPDDVALAQANQARSAVLSSVTMLRINQDPARGLTYYDGIKDKLDPQDAVRMDSAVTAARNGMQAKGIIANIMPSQARYDTFQELKAAGFAPGAAAALTGGVESESTFSPSAEKLNDAGPGLHSRGILQWNRERLAGLQQFAAAGNMDINSASTQRKFMIKELTDPNSPYKAIGDQLKRSDITVEEANRLVTDQYIVPAFSRQKGPASDQEYANRLARSKLAYEQGNAPADQAMKDRSLEKLQGIIDDPNIPDPVKQEVVQRVRQANSIESMRRETTLKNARDLEDASIQDAITGKINSATLATKLTDAAGMALQAQDRSEHRRLSYLAGQASAISNFSNMPLDRAKESLATFMQGTAKALAGGQIAADKEVREQERIETNNKMEAFNQGVAGGQLQPGALAGLAADAFKSYVKTQDFAKALDVKTKYEAWIRANAGVLGRHDQVETTMREMEDTLNKNGAAVGDVYKMQYMQKLVDRQERDYKQDAYTYAEEKLVRQGLAPRVELNLAGKDPTLLMTQLRARNEVAKQAEALEGRPIPALRTAEIEQLWNHLNTADPATKASLLTMMGKTITGHQLEMLAPALSQKGSAGYVYYAAMIGYGKSDPYYTDISNRMIRGADLIWKGGEGAKDVTTNDLIWKTTLNASIGGAMTGMAPEQINMLMNSVKALYVDGQGRMGGKWGEPVDDGVLNKAIKDAVGEIDVINGQKVILPRGATRADVKGAIRYGLPEETTNRLRSADGTPITPATLADRGTFVSVGDGKYAVMLPEGHLGSRVLKPVSDPNDRTKPWVLDINGPLRTYRAHEGAVFDPASPQRFGDGASGGEGNRPFGGTPPAFSTGQNR